jgi:DNA-binding transcriptional ArsR family regulator
LQSTLAAKLGKTDRHVRNYLSELRSAGLLTVKKDGRNPATYVLTNQIDRKENFRSSSGLISGRYPVYRRASLYESKLGTQERLWPKPVQRAETLNPAAEREFWARYDREMALPLEHKSKKAGKA